MKIQLDTTNKTVKIEESVSLETFYDFITKLLPNDEWKNYQLKVELITNWSYPITIKEYIPYWQQPWYNQNPYVINCSSDTNSTLLTTTSNNAIFNLQLE